MHHTPMISPEQFGIFAQLFVLAFLLNGILHLWRWRKIGHTHHLTHAAHHLVMGVTMSLAPAHLIFHALCLVIALEALLAAHIWWTTYKMPK